MDSKSMIAAGAGAVCACVVALPAVWVLVPSGPSASPVGLRGSGAPAAPAAPRVEFRGEAVATPHAAATTAHDPAQEEMIDAAGGRERTALSVEQGAQTTSEYLAGVDRPDEVLGLARVMADDPEMKPHLLRQAEAWLASSDPAERARGLLLLAGLGELEAAAWASALTREQDAEARALIVSQAPFGLDAGSDAQLSATLLETARLDRDSAVRSAALGSLPIVGPDGLTSVASILRQDTDPLVREGAALYLRGVRSTQPEVVQGLLASARNQAEQPEVRRASLVALMRIEESSPGTLEANGGSREQLTQVIEGTTAEQG